MASVVINGDTSGSVTLQAPAAAGATVLTLPSTSGTIVITSGAQTIEFADGSASAPSITNSGDTNTGIFFPAADTIAFAEGGVETMRLDASGNVGIGGIGSYKLNVISDLGMGLYNSAGTSVGIFTPGSTFEIANYFSTGSNITFSTNPNGGGNAERMRIDSTGNVGIGSNNPTEKVVIEKNSPDPFNTVQTHLLLINGGGNQGAGNRIAFENGNARAWIQSFVAGGNFNSGLDLVFGTPSSAVTGTEQMRITSAGLLQFNSGYGSVATAFGCRAWVNFNGTGAVAIRASGNVTSITDNGTGDYTVNFTTAMPNVNYSPVFGVGRGSVDGNASVTIRFDTAPTASALRITTQFSTVVTLQDFVYVNVAIFR